MSVLSRLGTRLERRWPRFGQVVETIQRKNITFMAGSVAFTAFLSLVPLLVLLYIAVAVLGDEQLVTQLIEATRSFLPTQARSLLAGSIRRRTEPSSGSIVSIVVLLWGSLKLFVSLDTAFVEIYAATRDESLADKVEDSVVAFTVLLVAALAAIGAGAAFAFLDWFPYVGIVTPLFLFVGLVAAFLPIYYVFPDVETSVRTALPGTLVAAAGWTLLQTLFHLYISLGGIDGGSGLLGGVVILLTWLYFGSLILLVGAVVNAVLSGHLEQGQLSDAPAGLSDRIA